MIKNECCCRKSQREEEIDPKAWNKFSKDKKREKLSLASGDG
jgi:hypothetical protein